MIFFTKKEKENIDLVITKFYYKYPAVINYIDNACLRLLNGVDYFELLKTDNNSEEELSEYKVIIIYLFYQVIESFILMKNDDDDVYQHISSIIENTLDVSLCTDEEIIKKLIDFILVLLYAYNNVLRLNWIDKKRIIFIKNIIKPYEYAINVCTEILDFTPELASNHERYAQEIRQIFGNRLPTYISQVLDRNVTERIFSIKMNSITLDDIITALETVDNNNLDAIGKFLLPIIQKSYGMRRIRSSQSECIRQKINQRLEMQTIEPAQIRYCSYISVEPNSGISKSDVHEHLKIAIEGGPTQLVGYLESDEGKKYIKFRGANRKQILDTLNREFGTDIKYKSFSTAINRKNQR